MGVRNKLKQLVFRGPKGSDDRNDRDDRQGMQGHKPADSIDTSDSMGGSSGLSLSTSAPSGRQPGPSWLLDGSTSLSHRKPKNGDTPIYELWDLAYENLRQTDETLIGDYESKLRADFTAALGSMTLSSRAHRRDQMRTILQAKMDEINRETWKLKFGSSEVQVKDLVQPVLGVVNWANEYITAAMNTNPSASIAWGGVSLLLPIFLNPSKQAASLASGLEYISSLIDQSRLWETLYNRRCESSTGKVQAGLPTPSTVERIVFKESLEALYQEILRFQIGSYCYYANNTAFRIGQDMIKWHEWDIMMEKVQNQKRIFSEVNSTWQDITFAEEHSAAERRHDEAITCWQGIGNDMSGLADAFRSEQAERKRKGLLDWLCPVDHSTAYNAERAKHMRGTSDWLVQESDEFKTWGKSPSSLLWLHGKPGCGKSMLSSSVISYIKDRLESDHKTALAYFFFSFSDEQKRRVDIMLASLIKQLYASRSDTPRPVEILGGYQARGERPDTKTLESALLATADGFSATFIVLDALDECSIMDRERSRLLDSLVRIVKAMPANIHILCTSRPEPDIVAEMNTMLSGPSGAAIDLTKCQDSINHDISLYIDSKFLTNPYCSWPGRLKEKTKAALMKNADGMFQYIYCQLEALLKHRSIKTVEDELQRLPVGLDATYETLLLNLDPDFRTEIISLLKWLASSTKDLGRGELAEIFVFKPDRDESLEDVDRLFEPADCIQYISGLVVTEEMIYSRRTRLAHFTVKEYLTSERILNGNAACFAFTEIDAHSHIAHLSLSYQSRLKLHKGHNNGITLDDVYGLPLARYAINSWASHLEIVPREQWSTDVPRLAELALTMRSETLRTRFRLQSGVYDDLDLFLSAGLNLGDVERPYFYTARKGFLQITEMLLEGGNGTDWYLTQQDMDRTLTQAARGGNIDLVKMLISKGADPKAVNGSLGGALQAAAFEGHGAIVELLLSHGADIDAHHGEVGSALLAAVLGHRISVAQLLVRLGANVNAYSIEAGCPLMSAVSGGEAISQPSDESLRFLFDSGADINVHCPNRGTALHLAAATVGKWRKGHSRCFYMLLEKGAETNLSGGQHGTVLQALCQNEGAQESDIKLLLDRGVDVNARGGKYGSALQAVFASLALPEVKLGIAKLLLDRGADINIQGGFYGTALQSACTDSDSLSFVQFLLENGADVGIQGGYFGNALQAACAWMLSDHHTVRLLLDKGADVNALGGEFGHSLQAAVSDVIHNTDVLELLLSRGADVHKQCGRYGTALQASCLGLNTDKVQILLDHGSEVNAEGGEYGTALQAACVSRNDDAVRLLIEHGADIHLGGGMFGSAWHAAASHIDTNTEILELLLNSGVDINDAQGSKYASALQAALEQNYDFTDWSIERTRFLLDHGADVNSGGGKYGFPLQSACANVHGVERAMFLLTNCPDIDVNGAGGIFGSALQAAAYSGQTQSIRMLLDKGAEINRRGGKYGSALNAAVFHWHRDIVEILLERGAVPDSQQLSQPDESWLSDVRSTFFDDQRPLLTETDIDTWNEKQRVRAWDEAGEGAVQRYMMFWEKTRTP